MCQLTLLDFNPKTFIPRTFVRSLVELNTYGWSGKNDDGFGYMTFAKPGEITKTNLDSMKWWVENEKDFLRSIRNANGIYHVRAASNNVKDIHEEDAHPFRVKDIVLAHNGTLLEKSELRNNKKLQKLFETGDKDKSMIDSEKFTHILANIVGDNKLTANHIDDAVDKFSGAFCFLIYDVKQPRNVYIVRGKDRKLHMAEFFDASDKTTKHGKPIGIAINTGRLELIYWSKIIKMTMAQYSKMKLNIRVKELPEETAWKYRLGSYKLDEPVREIKQRVVGTVVYSQGRHVHHNAAQNVSTTSSDPVYQNIVDISLEMGLYMSEVFLLSEIIFDEALHILDDDGLEFLLKMLEFLKKQNFKGRQKEWKANLIAKNLTPINAYKMTGLEFPYMFSSKKVIRSKFKKIKKEEE
jgi:predicted glutamine amidotransferase